MMQVGGIADGSVGHIRPNWQGLASHASLSAASFTHVCVPKRSQCESDAQSLLTRQVAPAGFGAAHVPGQPVTCSVMPASLPPCWQNPDVHSSAEMQAPPLATCGK